jgi:formyltetrahydrofolate synthetase
MTIKNIGQMSNATLALRAVAAKRVVDAADRDYAQIVAEIRKREGFGTIETDGGKVTLGTASERVALDTDRAKVLIPTWATTCSKVSVIAPSVRVTFN